MKSYTENLHKELLSKLDELNRGYDPLMLTDPRLSIITETIDKIKEKLKTHKFKTIEDEITFFKDVLPNTLSLYFYYKDKIEWDRIIRLGTENSRYKYHDRIFSQAENFRKENKVFYGYCRDGKTEYDNFYFLRNSPTSQEQKYQVRRIVDPSTPPLYCEILAKYIAFNRLEFESKKIIAEEDESLHPIKIRRTKLRWTGKQIEIIELGYALKETGSFNDGEATLKEIFDFLEEVFELELGNTYRAFHDVIRRKGPSTVFLDHMKQKLLYRIEVILN